MNSQSTEMNLSSVGHEENSSQFVASPSVSKETKSINTIMPNPPFMSDRLSASGASQLKTLRPLRAFLCHASSDKAVVRTLYHRLLGDGIDPWLDEEKLLPGQHWRDEIPKAVRDSDVVLVCLSRGSINRSGYVQKEIKYALDVADEQPEGTIYIIPLKLEDCEIPAGLSHVHGVNYYEDKGYERLLRALQVRASKLPDVTVEVKS